MKKLFSGFAVLMLIVCMVPQVAVSAAETRVAKVTFSEVSAKKGETIEIYVTLVDSPNVKSMGVSPIYDSERLEYLNGEWLVSGGILQDWSNSEQNGVILYSEDRDLNGNVAKYSFRIKDNTKWDDISFSAKIVLKGKDGNIEVNVVPTYIVIKCDHSWNTEVLTSPSTCKDNGYTYNLCSICNRKKILSTFNKLEHVSSDWIIDELATIHSEGLKHKECLDCGEVLAEQIIPVLGTCVHSFGEEILISSPTCDKAGYIYNVCSICNGENVLYDLEKLDHTPSDWIVVEQATDDGEGLQCKECVNCGVNLSTQIIPALGTCSHNYSEQILITYPSYEEDGCVYRVCSTCSKKDILYLLDKPTIKKTTVVVVGICCGFGGVFISIGVYFLVKLIKKKAKKV